jgi:phospholipase/carboxylesterase
VSASLDTLVHRIRPSAAEPDGVLVLLHGRGTDENDLHPLLDVLDPERRLTGFTPRAPLALPPGGRHWYVVRRVGFPDPETFGGSYTLLTDWLDALPEAPGVPWERIVIGGFSQGTAMSYAVALGAGRPRPAGLIALSGFIPEVPGFELDLENARGLPVAIGHGAHDPIIGVEFGREARAKLEAAGADVTYRESVMAHSVDPAFLHELAGWVSNAVPPR